MLFVFTCFSIMRSGNGTKVCSPVDQFCHPGFGFLVCLLPLGILQPIADTGFVYIGYIRTEYFILTAQLVHLIAELAVTLLHTVEQSVRDTVLHTVELVLVSGIHQVNISVSLPCQFFLIQFLDIFALTLHFLDFLSLRLSAVTRTGMIRFTSDFGSLKRTRNPELNQSHFQYISAPEYFLCRKK